MRARTMLLLLLTGCSFFSRSKSQFYSLERIPPSAAVATVRGVPVAIDTVELPPGIDRREVVVRQANHQLEVRSTQQWSAPFQEMVLHTLAFDVANRLPEGMMVLPGEARPAGSVRTIDVVLEELAAGPGRNVVLDARWTLAGVTHHDRIAIDIESLDSAQVAAGVSRALGSLADRIALEVSR